jgi:ABC-2 type transport system ATP-binding protein
MVLDEPMSGLDPAARALVKARLARLAAAGTTLFFSTHLLADVEALCDRVAVLHAGRLAYLGTPAGLVAAHRAASLEAAFLACIGAAPAPPG